MSDRDALEAAAVEIAGGVAAPPAIDDAKAVVWEALLVEAAIVLLTMLAERCSRVETPESVRRRAIAIRDRNWLNFGLRRAYNAVWYEAKLALTAAEVPFDAEDVYRLADRTIAAAAAAPAPRIAAVMRAARS